MFWNALPILSNIRFYKNFHNILFDMNCIFIIGRSRSAEIGEETTQNRKL